jgi:hypothetical protein
MVDAATTRKLIDGRQETAYIPERRIGFTLSWRALERPVAQ